MEGVNVKLQTFFERIPEASKPLSFWTFSPNSYLRMPRAGHLSLQISSKLAEVQKVKLLFILATANPINEEVVSFSLHLCDV